MLDGVSFTVIKMKRVSLYHLNNLNDGVIILFQDGFPVNLREDLYKVIKQIPTKTYNDVSIGTTEEIIGVCQESCRI